MCFGQKLKHYKNWNVTEAGLTDRILTIGSIRIVLRIAVWDFLNF